MADRRAAARSICFNEAGILHPEKRPRRGAPSSTCSSFNEAGILHPEKRGPIGLRLENILASMRPGFYTRKSPELHQQPGYLVELQ